jgi:MYXO-CTERM domain-containing protein
MTLFVLWQDSGGVNASAAVGGSPGGLAALILLFLLWRKRRLPDAATGGDGLLEETAPAVTVAYISQYGLSDGGDDREELPAIGEDWAFLGSDDMHMSEHNRSDFDHHCGEA